MTGKGFNVRKDSANLLLVMADPDNENAETECYVHGAMPLNVGEQARIHQDAYGKSSAFSNQGFCESLWVHEAAAEDISQRVPSQCEVSPPSPRLEVTPPPLSRILARIESPARDAKVKIEEAGQSGPHRQSKSDRDNRNNQEKNNSDRRSSGSLELAPLSTFFDRIGREPLIRRDPQSRTSSPALRRSTRSTTQPLSGSQQNFSPKYLNVSGDGSLTSQNKAQSRLLSERNTGNQVGAWLGAEPGPPSVVARTAGSISGGDSVNRLGNMAPAQPEGGWTEDAVVAALAGLSSQMNRNHARMIRFSLEQVTQNPPHKAPSSNFDPFADMDPVAVTLDKEYPKDSTMCVKVQQHTSETVKKGVRKARIRYLVVSMKSAKERVPKYSGHHIELRRNLAPYERGLHFIPHLRDIESDQEALLYEKWKLKLQRDFSDSTGFTALNEVKRTAKRQRTEHAARFLIYLEPWLTKLKIPGCTKEALIHYMASHLEERQGPVEAVSLTAAKRAALKRKLGAGTLADEARHSADMFTRAFNRVFDNRHSNRQVHRQASLREALLLDPAVKRVLDSDDNPANDMADDVLSADLAHRAKRHLATYSHFQCLICGCHDCAHGELDVAENGEQFRRYCSVDEWQDFVSVLRKTWAARKLAAETYPEELLRQQLARPCKNRCWLNYVTGSPNHPVRPWSAREVGILESLVAALAYGKVHAQCVIACYLSRKCWDVYRKIVELDLDKFTIWDAPSETACSPSRTLSWYDNKKKQLRGQFWKHTVTGHINLRSTIRPCNHQGPCSKECPCVQAKVLCEKFCLCTKETCARKFTGCSCILAGKTCTRPSTTCVCVQLNRECDPVLCGSCGARDRADPEYTWNTEVHAYGCQNVPLQRGATKKLVTGRSQLEDCGYGVYAAEDMAKDDFIDEYTGELISGVEGIRREAARGGAFDNALFTSYSFTLFETLQVCVDAQNYGNHTRYINHAPAHSANVYPKYFFVNGEYRICFFAARDTMKGEELFFDYGNDFFRHHTKEMLGHSSGQPRFQVKTLPPGRGGRSGRPGESKSQSRESGPTGQGTDVDDIWVPLPQDDPEDDDYRASGSVQTAMRMKRPHSRVESARRLAGAMDEEADTTVSAVLWRSKRGVARPGARRTLKAIQLADAAAAAKRKRAMAAEGEDEEEEEWLVNQVRKRLRPAGYRDP